MMPYPPPPSLLPHSGRAVLLDEVVEADAGRIVCRVSIKADSPFVENGRVPSVVVLEYMAQAIAALAGLQAKAAGDEPRVGLLLGTRELTLAVDAFGIGDQLLVEACRVFGDDLMGSFDCTASRSGTRIAAATLNVVLLPKEGSPG